MLWTKCVRNIKLLVIAVNHLYRSSACNSKTTRQLQVCCVACDRSICQHTVPAGKELYPSRTTASPSYPSNPILLHPALLVASSFYGRFKVTVDLNHFSVGESRDEANTDFFSQFSLIIGNSSHLATHEKHVPGNQQESQVF